MSKKKIFFYKVILFFFVTDIFCVEWVFHDRYGKEIQLQHHNAGKIDKEKLDKAKEVFMKSFIEAYKNIPSENMHTFLSNAFDEESADFLQDKSNLHIFTAYEKEKLIGFITYEIISDEAYIRKMALDPEYWNTGIGKVLTFALLCPFPDIKKFATVTRQSNQQARRLYEKLGLKQSDYKTITTRFNQHEVHEKVVLDPSKFQQEENNPFLGIGYEADENTVREKLIELSKIIHPSF